MKRRIKVTYGIAFAAGKDAANANMRKCGREVWNEDDFNIAARTMNDLLGDPTTGDTTR